MIENHSSASIRIPSPDLIKIYKRKVIEMSRSARKKSNSGIYHVMIRGINCQQIFEDDQDNYVFIKILRECKEKCGFKLLAYCLMGNHVHLLIHEGETDLGTIFKHIGVRYVYWYNTKYERSGHLFQDRFKSEPVDDMSYLITVIRYIHRNPVKAGICKKPEDYQYSSIKEYYNDADIVDMDYVEQFVSRTVVLEDDDCLSTDDFLEMKEKPSVGITDQKAKGIIKSICGCESLPSFQTLPQTEQKKCITALKAGNASIRQISRLTGITYYTIQKYLKQGTVL